MARFGRGTAMAGDRNGSPWTTSSAKQGALMRTTPFASLIAILLTTACSAAPVDLVTDQPPAEAADSTPPASAEGGFI
jgi:hypothetical protein